MRSRRAIIVGDPMQIEPVVVLPDILTHAICRTFGIDPDQFNAPAASVQTLADAANLVVGSSTGTKIATATTQKLGFYNATPVVQQATTGTTTGFTASSGTSVRDDSTFTGNSGTKAYTIGDIVLALKNLGLLAAS